MNVNGHPFRTIWIEREAPSAVHVIDQRVLPHQFVTHKLTTVEQMHNAIADMTVRGAPLIGVAGAFGVYLAALQAPENEKFDAYVRNAALKLERARPTAVNLAWAIAEQLRVLEQSSTREQKVQALLDNAQAIADEDVATCRNIGKFGLEAFQQIFAEKGKGRLNVLTHCNAGWLCAVDVGTATAPIYAAHDAGIPIHVWVDETRPRNQGASLTAWELGQHGVDYTLITDNAGGQLMRNGQVDVVIVGTDRVTRCGDVTNKVGTYLKALAARDNNVPFYVGAPSSSIDWSLLSGDNVPIEERHPDEVRLVPGLAADGNITQVLICPEDAKISNIGFDVTPNRLVTGLITERGICAATEAGLLSLYPEKRQVVAR